MDINSIQNRIKTLKKNRFLRYGLPFVLMIVGGSFGLQQFTQLRYTFRKTEKFSRAEAEKRGIIMAPSKSPEEIYEEIKEENLDHWENIRGPRPWEDSKTVQDEQRLKKTSQT